jgi:hypothetical protein
MVTEMQGVEPMAILNVTTLTVPGSAWNETMEDLKKASPILEKAGAQDVRILSPIVGGGPTGTLHQVWETGDVATLGKVLDSVYTNDEILGMMMRAGELGVTWQNSILADMP